MPYVQQLLQYKNPYFVETGTYQGETTEYVKNYYDNIITLELSEVFYRNCKNKFNNDPKIKLFHANSKTDLWDIISSIDSQITFWLDSHWSGVPDVGCDPETLCPILEELDQISKHPIKTHTIIIDDMRLMNGKDFLATKEQIIDKILTINPDYNITYYSDFTAKDDVLVAYIFERPTCVHKYIKNCKTNPLSPGLADFLRGCLTLLKLSSINNYDFKIEKSSNPCFQYFEDSEYFINLPHDDKEIIELLPPHSYETIFYNLTHLFNSRQHFNIITNSFYKNDEGKMIYYVEDENMKNIMKQILTPNKTLKDKVNDVLSTLQILNQDYTSIHVRVGDKFLNDSSLIDDDIYNRINTKIKSIIENNPENKYLLLCDSVAMANKLVENNKTLKYFPTEKTHLGGLQNSTADSVFQTLVDFFLLTKSKAIVAVTPMGSGFSYFVSNIYNIPYTVELV